MRKISPIKLTTTFAALEALSAVTSEDPADYQVLTDNATWAIAYEIISSISNEEDNPLQDIAAALGAEAAVYISKDRLNVSHALMRFMSINIAKSLL